MKALLRQLRPAITLLALFTLVLGLAYPLLVTGFAQVFVRDQADGSLVRADDGTVVGSRLIGQPFTGPTYFHPRPSAAGAGYDGSASSGSNLGPNSAVLLDTVAGRVSDFRRVNGLDASVKVPVDAVTASGSGLDPHISIANARLQAPRIAQQRQLDLDEVLRLVDEHTDDRQGWVLGEPGVNVLDLNLALDSATGR